MSLPPSLSLFAFVLGVLDYLRRSKLPPVLWFRNLNCIYIYGPKYLLLFIICTVPDFVLYRNVLLLA